VIKRIMPYIARGISSDLLRDTRRAVNALKRRLTDAQPTLDIFLKADDPYSYLLIQALYDFNSRFNVSLKFHVFQEIDSEMYPRFEMWREYAKHDAYFLAKLYGYRFPAKIHLPVSDAKTANKLACSLVRIENDDHFLQKATLLLDNFWINGELNNFEVSDEQIAFEALRKNQALLEKRGHYLGAMINFEGEWYWGIDRLDHLESRLITMGLANSPDERIFFNRTYTGFCQKSLPNTHRSQQRPLRKPLALYWSARSPYSYIGLERAVQLSQHYQIPLTIKPVLPMMMRGMNVPKTKKMYIFLDTKREASKLNIPYGFVADPLGAAVERCYALIEYAQSENKLQDFLLSFARGVNSEGIRAETEKGMKKIVSRCGLSWDIAKTKFADKSWRSSVNDNLDEMLALGCWGVPSVCYDGLHFWGQDRMALMEHHIKEDIHLN